MAEPGCESDLAVPPAKRRDVDPIAQTEHPWDLPARLYVPTCSCNAESVVIPREANLPIDTETRRVVARVSQAVVAVVSVDADGDHIWKASGFVADFDETSMIGTIFSSATVARHGSSLPDFEKIKVYLFDGTSYDATVAACDYHWNLLVLFVSFDRVVKPIKLVEISENRNSRDPRLEICSLLPHLSCENLYPGDTIIGLGRWSEEPFAFGLRVNRGVYSTDRWTAFRMLCQEMQTATFLNTYASIGGPAINSNGRVVGMLFQSLTCTPFLPSNIILRWWEHFKNTGKYCRPTIRFLGVNLHNAQSSPWVKVPASLHEGLDGILVELASRAVLSLGLQQKDLIVRCNRRRVATNLQLFEILAENIGKMVELTVVKVEDGSTKTIHLPVEEAEEENFHQWPISSYYGGFF